MPALHHVDFSRGVRPSTIAIGKLATRIAELLPGSSALGGDGDPSIRAVVYDELRAYVRRLGMSFSEAGAVHSRALKDDENPAEGIVRSVRDDIAMADADANGTKEAPFDFPERGEAAVNESTTPGYYSCAFPVLFPFSVGGFSDTRDFSLEHDQYFKHLHVYCDDRFNSHPRWPYFALNTKERRRANEEAMRFVSRPTSHAGDDFASMTLGELKALSKGGTSAVLDQVSKVTKNLRNTPGFFKDRRKELQGMCATLGDPHVFATHSFADTYSAYLAEFMLKWRGLERDGEMSPFAPGISEHEAKTRKWNLLQANPGVAAHFFALKTELYLEHICVGILSATAYWSRYEWQSRGATHAHYFLWLRNTPRVTHLETWIREELDLIRSCRDGSGDFDGSGDSFTSDELGSVVEACNHRASTHEPTQQAAAWWAARAQHWNDAWDDAEQVPDLPKGAPHPAGLKFHDLGDVQELANYPNATNLRPGDVPKWLSDDVCLCRNRMTRHTDHVPYCLRRNTTTGELFCRFHFPLQGHEPQGEPHFYVERKGGTFRWKLHLGINDTLINSVNLWQMAAHRANVDFRPLFDHHTAIEYATKYATKAEKRSQAMEQLFSNAIARACERFDDDAPAVHAFSSFLVQTVASRDWSSQEARNRRAVARSWSLISCGHVAGWARLFWSQDMYRVS